MIKISRPKLAPVKRSLHIIGSYTLTIQAIDWDIVIPSDKIYTNTWFEEEEKRLPTEYSIVVQLYDDDESTKTNKYQEDLAYRTLKEKFNYEPISFILESPYYVEEDI